MKRLKTSILLSLAILSSIQLVAQAPEKEAVLSLEAFEQKLNRSPQPQILDVRSPEEYAENHLIGAINLNLADEAAFKKGVETLDKQKPVFVYSINNGRSGLVAKQLRGQGFIEVYDLPGGLARWLGTGKPIESFTENDLTLEKFQQLVESRNLVLVEIGSKYCGGCRKLAPIVAKVADEQGDKLKVVKVELYNNHELANALEIESVPTLIIYKNNKAVWRKSGFTPWEEINEALAVSL